MTSLPALARAPSLGQRVVGPLVLVAVAAALLAWTWRKWPDAVVDFGGEAYVAWRITAGDVLYRDLAYFTGPLSPYLNAAWFRVFGVSTMTLACANLALLAGTTACVYALAVRLAGRLAATAAGVMFLSLCALALHSGAGNYNFACPYSHEMTHGTLLSFAALLVLAHWLREPHPWHAAALGLLFGCVFLTKVEFTLALGVAAATAVLLAPHERQLRMRAAGVALSLACVPPLAAFALLASAMPARAAVHGVLGAWMYVGDGRFGDFPIYRAAMGLLPLDHHLIRLAGWSVAWSAFLVAAAAVARKWSTWRAALVVAAVVALGCALAFRSLPWVDALYPLPVFASAAIALLWWQRSESPRAPLRIAFAVFALTLLARILLSARVQFYGFALAAPALVLVTVMLVGWTPQALERRGGSAIVFRGAVLPLLAALALGHLGPMAEGLAWKTVPVGTGSDAFLADPRGEFIARASEAIERQVAPSGSVLVLPEGCMINFLTRRRSPTRYFNFMPPEMVMFGEQDVLAALQRSPPDAIVLVHKDTSEYGLPLFGRDYGAPIYAWVRAQYEPVKLWTVEAGQRPLEPGTKHAVALLKPRAPRR